MRKWRKTSLCVMAAALWLISACGAKTSEPASGTTASDKPAASAAAAATASASSGTVEQIKKNGKLVIATSGNFRPVTFMNEQSQLAGLDIDIGNMIAERLGVKAEFVPGNISGLIPGLVASKFDLVMSGLLATDERKKSIDFSIPYGMDGTIAVTLKDNTKVEDVTKLGGLVVGVIGGSGTHSVVKEIGGYKELKEYPGNAEAFTDLKAGRIDVYAVGNIAANDYIKNDKSDKPLKLVGKVTGVKPMGVGLRKNEPELKAIIDKLIEEKLKDGTIDQLATKWVGAPLPK